MLLFSSKDCNGFLFPKVNSDLCDLAPASLSSLILFPVQNAPDTLAFFRFLNTLNLFSAQGTWICWSSQKYSSNSFYCSLLLIWSQVKCHSKRGPSFLDHSYYEVSVPHYPRRPPLLLLQHVQRLHLPVLVPFTTHLNYPWQKMRWVR